MTKKVYEKIVEKESKNKIVFKRSKWVKLDPALKKLVLRSAILKISTLEDITQKQMQEVCEIIEKGEGKKGKILPRSLSVTLLSGKIIVGKE